MLSFKTCSTTFLHSIFFWKKNEEVPQRDQQKIFLRKESQSKA